MFRCYTALCGVVAITVKYTTVQCIYREVHVANTRHFNSSATRFARMREHACSFNVGRGRGAPTAYIWWSHASTQYTSFYSWPHSCAAFSRHPCFRKLVCTTPVHAPPAFYTLFARKTVCAVRRVTVYSFITCCFLKTGLHFGARLFRTPVLWYRHVLPHCVATSSLYTACDEMCDVEARWSRHIAERFLPRDSTHFSLWLKNAPTPNESRSESSAKYVCSWIKCTIKVIFF